MLKNLRKKKPEIDKHPQDSKVQLTIITNEKQLTKDEEKSSDINNSSDIVTSSPWLAEFNKKKKRIGFFHFNW